MVLALLVIGLFGIKNYIINGNPIFPFKSIEFLSADWRLPENVETYFANYMQPYAYHMDPQLFSEASFLVKIKHWLKAPMPHGYFNSLMLVLLVVMPFVIKRVQDKKAYWIIYGLAILNMILLFSSSPQYRFFFPFILCFGLILAALLFYKKRYIVLALSGSTLLAAVPLFVEINNDRLTSNPLHASSSTFKVDYLWHPHQNSQYSDAYKTVKLEETTINSPTQIEFFWGTGDLPLPALNEAQLDYFRVYFKVIPQQRTKDLKDGFYSKSLE